MDPVQLVILRLGLYELVELGLSPHAISEHVDLAKALVFPQAAGFTNGTSAAPVLLERRICGMQCKSSHCAAAP